MEKFTNIRSSCVPLPADNVDTDQIIPARFLKATTREGFGDNLFRDWRYYADNRPKEGFVLNDGTFKGTILLTGRNFGCGSSREHAAWAIYDYGFRVVISSFFADIFKNNALNNGLLPVTVPENFMKSLFETVRADPSAEVEVDLGTQTVRIIGSGQLASFDIDAYKKMCMINGYDDIDYLLSIGEDVEAFEKGG